MNKVNSKRQRRIKNLTFMAVFTALVAILAYLGGFIKIGGLASISLTLIPVVLGAALCGPSAGAWLGAVAGAVFFMTADSAFWLGLSIPGTIITVMVKGILSGLLVVGISTLVISLNSGFGAAAAKSPEMGVAAMAVSIIIVPLVSMITKNKDEERVEEIFSCYNED